jgi:plasmid maintenance system antidote protein VapI
MNQMFDKCIMANKKEISRKAGISTRHLEYILNKERNASARVAVKLEKLTGISKEVWVFGTKRQRSSAWKQLQQEQPKSITHDPKGSGLVTKSVHQTKL